LLHHLQFNDYALSAILGSLFFALELVVSRQILPYYSPIMFYFIRCSLIFVICFAIFQPKFKAMSKKVWKYTFITAAIWILYRFLIYSSYVTKGIIFTTVLFLLAPVFIFLFAAIFLREKVTLRNIIASAVIAICVAYSIWIGR
jgi:drug/metabolite transporter (DMT)-like permease